MARRLPNQLAAFLKKRRGSLTYMQFSRKMGISPATLHRLEMGQQNATLKTLEQIVDRLNCKVADIFREQ